MIDDLLRRQLQLEQVLGKMALDLAWIREELAHLRQIVEQQNAPAQPVYRKLNEVESDIRIQNVGGLSTRTLRDWVEGGVLSEEAGHLLNVSQGSKKARWMVNIPAVVEKLKCDRDLL